MKATWNGQVIAQAEKEDLIYIEGNWYFPPGSIDKQYFINSDTQTHCPWKGDASYYNVKIGDQTNTDAAWYYPAPKESAFEQTKKDFTSYVAFWRGVEVSE